MRLTTSALTAAVLGTALSATPLIAQQQTPPADGGMGMTTPSIPGVSASRGARYLLRNGWDYLKYQEYERALSFFRQAESRKTELNPAERQALIQGIDNARRGMREAGDGSAGRSYAGRGPIRRPGSFALGQPTQQPTAPEPIQLTSGSRTAPASSAGMSAPTPAAVAAIPTADADLPELPSSPAAPRTAAPASADQPATPDRMVARNELAPSPLADPALPAPRPVAAESPVPAPASATAPASAPAPAPASSGSDLPPLDLDSVPLPPLSDRPSSEPAPAPASAPASAPAPLPDPAPAPEPVAEPAAPPAAETPAQETETPSMLVPPATEAPGAEIPAPVPAATESLPQPRVATSEETAAPASEQPSSIPTPAAVESDEPPPPLPAESIPPRASASDSLIPERAANVPSSLSPELQREVERIAQKQEEELRSRAVPERSVPGGFTGEVGGMNPSAGAPSPRLEISRAPSPTEARPIRAIPVPDEFVPLPKRQWDPQRKYWSASAVCHMPLYFQDAALERYGQGVEQAVGPAGRFLSYPVDDPKQSTQRNQIVQPFASIGIFAAQIALLPYNLIMDPPWEAEYDLGYYRPGDQVPPDTYYLPLTGVGPPLHGKKY